MKRHNSKLVLVLLTLCMILAAAISMPNVQAASKLKLNKTSVTLEKGESVTLKLKGTKKKVTWSSNKKKVATVTKKGKVTAKKVGTAKITAKVGKKKYTCKVKVVDWKEMGVRNIGDYSYRMYDDGVWVAKYNGTSANTTVPSEIEGYQVQGIVSSVFKDNSTVVSIVISEGITKINRDVCWNCPNLTSVVVPASVTKIYQNSFGKCPNLIASVYPDSYAKFYMLSMYIPIKIIE